MVSDTGVSFGGEIASEYMSNVLQNARQDPTIKAVVLRVDSPGGYAPACCLVTVFATLTVVSQPILLTAQSAPFAYCCSRTEMMLTHWATMHCYIC